MLRLVQNIAAVERPSIGGWDGTFAAGTRPARHHNTTLDARTLLEANIALYVPQVDGQTRIVSVPAKVPDSTIRMVLLADVPGTATRAGKVDQGTAPRLC